MRALEAVGDCLSVSLGLCVHAVLVQHFMAINVAHHQIIQIGREFHRMSGPVSFESKPAHSLV